MTTTEQRELLSYRVTTIGSKIRNGCGSKSCMIAPRDLPGHCRCRPGKLAMELLAISEELQEIVTWKDAEVVK